LDQAAIEEVRQESWPVVRDPDELHDALLTLLWLPVEEVQDWAIHLPRLIDEGRAVELNLRGEAQEVRGWVATEYQAQWNRCFRQAMKPLPMPSCLVGWKASGQRRQPNSRRDYIVRLRRPINHWCASKHPDKSSADNFDLSAELKIQNSN